MRSKTSKSVDCWIWTRSIKKNTSKTPLEIQFHMKLHHAMKLIMKLLSNKVSRNGCIKTADLYHILDVVKKIFWIKVDVADE